MKLHDLNFCSLLHGITFKNAHFSVGNGFYDWKYALERLRYMPVAICQDFGSQNTKFGVPHNIWGRVTPNYNPVATGLLRRHEQSMKHADATITFVADVNHLEGLMGC